MTRLEVLADADTLAAAVAGALVARIAELQASAPDYVVQLCLTGGGIAAKVHERFAAELVASAVDPVRLELWWGDERFVPADSPDRNAEPALALLAGVGLDPAKVHPMPPSSAGLSLDDAAGAYDDKLGETTFDVCMLGLGPDGHIASMFPDHPSSGETGARVIGVLESPKPPPERISLTVPVINASAAVWFLVSGAEKAPAAARAYAQDTEIPAGRAHGESETIFWLDAGAATDIA